MKKIIGNVMVAGGSGLWAEQNHYPAFLSLKAKGIPVKIGAICDPINPFCVEKGERRPNLNKLLKGDEGVWVDPTGKSQRALAHELDALHHREPFTAVFVSSNPVSHYFYCRWAMEKGIPVLCDKPIVTTENSAFDGGQAAKMHDQFEKLESLYHRNKKQNPSYSFCVPLRRRALAPFIKIAEGLEDVHRRTGEGLRYANVIVNGGIHKYPEEYLKGGAHGHLDGVGTLSHSSYHYLDVLAWYLQAARGEIRWLEVQVPFVLRVRDYLKTGGYRPLRKLIEDDGRCFNDGVCVPREVLDTELDFNAGIRLKDGHGNRVGQINFLVNYSSFAPRLTKFDPLVTEYAHDRVGGRMSSVYLDIHQGALQQWQLIKNEENALGHEIELRRGLHPRLGTKTWRYVYEDAYERAPATAQEIVAEFIKLSMGRRTANSKKLLELSSLPDQALSMRLYAAVYEQIAAEYRRSLGSRTVAPTVIDLNDFMPAN